MTFDACQDVLQGKNRRITECNLPYSGGLFTCAYCGQAITGERIQRRLRCGGVREHTYNAKSAELKSDALKAEEEIEKLNDVQTLDADLGLKLFDWSQNVAELWLGSNNRQTVRDLGKFDIRYDEIILVNSLEDKARVIQERGIAVYFDDQDECLKDIPDSVSVFKVRNGGNFDEETRRWLYSEETGQLV